MGYPKCRATPELEKKYGEQGRVLRHALPSPVGLLPCHTSVSQPLPKSCVPAGVQQDNSQSVLRVSNKVTLQQTWFNEARTKKPQTFAAAAAEAAAFDSTNGGETCDFCK